MKKDDFIVVDIWFWTYSHTDEHWKIWIVTRSRKQNVSYH